VGRLEPPINMQGRFYQNRRKTPSFNYGDIRRVTYTVGHTGIHAWGNRVRRQFFGGGAVVIEPRIPRL